MSEAENGFTPEKFMQLVHSEIKKLDDVKVYYECKKISGTLVRRNTDLINIIKICLVLSKIGFPIETSIVAYISGKKYNTRIRQKLHNLGDRKILVLKRKGKRKLTWIIRPDFYKRAMGVSEDA